MMEVLSIHVIPKWTLNIFVLLLDNETTECNFVCVQLCCIHWTIVINKVFCDHRQNNILWLSEKDHLKLNQACWCYWSILMSLFWIMRYTFEREILHWIVSTQRLFGKENVERNCAHNIAIGLFGYLFF